MAIVGQKDEEGDGDDSGEERGAKSEMCPY